MGDFRPMDMPCGARARMSTIPARAAAWSLGVAAALIVSGTAGATSLTERRIDPQLRRLARDTPADTIGAILRLPAADPATLAALEARGVEFRRGASGAPRHLGALYPVRGRASLLRDLGREGLSVSVGRAEFEDPTMSTGTEIEAWAVHAHGPTPMVGPSGRGVTVVDIDNAIDLFHPHFFRADGGAYRWVDVDGDGMLVPGIDGIDTNVDGEIEEHEILQLMDYAQRYYAGGGGYEYGGLNGSFDPSVDYLYVDFDGDGQRDYGPNEGYSEGSPGYGEAMFLPDDANGDGMLDTDERVLLLGTSKLAIYRRGPLIWRRGEDLINAPHDDYDLAGHGTSVVGILVGGQDRLFRLHRGLLPDAEMILLSRYSNYDEAELVDNLAWATQEEGADVVLHEYATWYDIHLDGSRPLDEAIDASVDEGIVHVCPAGNLQESGKHTYVEGASVASMPFSVPGSQYHYFRLDLHWDASVELQCTLADPLGNALPIVEDSVQVLVDTSVVSTRWDSPRGTALLSLEMSRPTGLVGGWSIDCTHAAPSLGIHAYLDDSLTSWGRGVTFDQEVPSSTMCSPSTADRCLAVAAYLWQHAAPYGGDPGDLAPYSSLGPRIDGGKTIDIAAPSDPFAPYPSIEDPALGFDGLFFQNNYAAFSGTSGAGPHVAAVAALLRQDQPVRSGETINEQIFAGAAVDAETSANPDGWGRGRVRAHQALYDEPGPARPDFVGRDLSVEFVPDDGECIAVLSVDDVDWPSPSSRWDEDYDGTWDTEFIEGTSHELTLTADAPAIDVRVEFGQQGWRIGGAALTAEAPASCFEPFEGTTDGTSGVDSTGDLPGGTVADASTGDGSTTGDEPGQAEDGGCGCRATPRHGGLGLGVLVLVLGLRRRRPIA